MNLERYKRQIPILGAEGQEKLRRSKVLLVGVGGLGSQASIHLALAGVGEIILIDRDVVEIHNLNRQPLYREKDVGKPKAKVAAERLKELNPEVEVRALVTELGSLESIDAIKEADVVLDCLDTIKARLLLNKICVENRKPLIHAGVRGFYGQLTTIIPGETPCLACLYQEPDHEEPVPVVSPTVGVLASLQASEALKILAGISPLATGKMVVVDLKYMEFDVLKIARNPNCKVCSSL